MDVLATMVTFVRVVEAGSLSAAGKQLRISVAAVSRQIAALERELGTTLVARTTRKMTVTAPGQEYYERCLRILREVDEAQSAFRGGAFEGSLRISIPVTLGFRNGASLFAPLLAKHPTLRLDLRFEDRLVDLVLEDVDVAIRVAAAPPLSAEIVAQPLSRWSCPPCLPGALSACSRSDCPAPSPRDPWGRRPCTAAATRALCVRPAKSGRLL